MSLLNIVSLIACGILFFLLWTDRVEANETTIVACIVLFFLGIIKVSITTTNTRRR